MALPFYGRRSPGKRAPAFISGGEGATSLFALVEPSAGCSGPGAQNALANATVWTAVWLGEKWRIRYFPVFTGLFVR